MAIESYFISHKIIYLLVFSESVVFFYAIFLYYNQASLFIIVIFFSSDFYVYDLMSI